ncbi:unnamed protein product [Periconia digitata]|uniref:Uncharacterized protein n=1 Tax=Periconia digitata TaxID=1303443 RepID=A0A9W4UC71_9PLEO|nr:unnamed protein product [Periconia digitata]
MPCPPYDARLSGDDPCPLSHPPSYCVTAFASTKPSTVSAAMLHLTQTQTECINMFLRFLSS